MRGISITAIGDRTSNNNNLKVTDDDCCRTDSGFDSSGVVDDDVIKPCKLLLLPSASTVGDSGLGLDSNFAKLSVVDATSTRRCDDEDDARRSAAEAVAFHPDGDGDTHLHLAVVHGRWDVINELISLAPHPIYLDIQNNLFQTPLHLAVVMGMPRVVRRLLLAGAAADVRNRHGNTPLHLACEHGDVDCVLELLRPVSVAELHDAARRLGGAAATSARRFPFRHDAQNLEIRNYEGQTCLHLAALGQHIDVIVLLKSYGANIDAQDGKSGRTALCYAIEARNLELMMCLVRDCQASVSEATFAGYTPFQLAYNVGTDFAEALLTGSSSSSAIPLSSDDSDADEYSSTEEDVTMETNECAALSYGDLRINGEPLW